jgi:hypothetical protein
MNARHITRRAALGQLGALLAAGLWPGALRAEGRPTGAGAVRFAVINDFHHDSAACDAWFEKLFASVAAQGRLAFVAGLGDLANAGKPESIAAIKRLAAAVPAPFYPVPGNHDWNGPTGLSPYLDYFELPGNGRCVGPISDVTGNGSGNSERKV